ncbi:MAG: hypothetical protein PHO37_18325, partial [Kiritimatiellae bacterium]|nr:hypothetical protein [Kiritimatiellia bacterium]
MKITRKILIGIAMATSAACAGYGTTNYWDNNSDTSGFGTAGGTWGLDSNWSGDSTGASVPGVTDTTAADQVNFGTAS